MIETLLYDAEANRNELDEVGRLDDRTEGEAVDVDEPVDTEVSVAEELSKLADAIATVVELNNSGRLGYGTPLLLAMGNISVELG